jgi:ubiquinone/menaquinone biosynthesis C-methylase UbiE
MATVVRVRGEDGRMTDIWSRVAGRSGLSGLDYWQYFGVRLVEQAGIGPGAHVLDVGCGTGSSLYPTARRVGGRGQVTGIDLCPH